LELLAQEDPAAFLRIPGVEANATVFTLTNPGPSVGTWDTFHNTS